MAITVMLGKGVTEMSVTARKWMCLVTVALLAGSIAVLASCSSPAGSSSASASASSESASSVSSEAVGMVNPWSDAASAEEAAKGAGLEERRIFNGVLTTLTQTPVDEIERNDV